MKKKILAIIATLTLVMSSSIVAYAADPTTTTVTDDTTGSINVTADVSAVYYVQLPATLELTRNAETGVFEGTYTVGVRGQINDSQKIKITPDASFTMTSTSNVGHTANATVSQPVNTWRMYPYADGNNILEVKLGEYTTTTGTVSCTFNELESYTGTLGFTFQKEY